MNYENFVSDLVKTNSARSNVNKNLLNNSILYLEQYRNNQSNRLKKILNIFIESTTNKFGSIDNIKEDRCLAIESQRDIDMINKLVDLKTFAIIPVFIKDDDSISHFYTMGMWYYWGLPEIVFTFDTPIKENAEFINVVTNILHDKIFAMYRNRIISSDINTINRINFEAEPEILNIELENFDIDFKMTRIDSNRYMDIQAVFMMWFYMYYMNAELDENKQPCLYPVYQINIGESEYSQKCKILIEKILSSIDKMQKNNDTESDKSESDLSDLSDILEDFDKLHISQRESDVN